MKERVLIFAGEDEAAASKLAAKLRGEGRGAVALSSFLFDAAEDCDQIEIMPDVPGFLVDKIKAAYPGKYTHAEAISEPQPEIILQPKRRGRPKRAA